ncbi:MAG: hypothetical protein D6805_08740 [Planctomycetota bacterium]|nr:MAG: hypothetical protein D6805_08740 [Planctomycetota bacterium]
MRLLAEVFPVSFQKLPSLYAYRPVAEAGDFSLIGKLLYELHRAFPTGHWIWHREWILSDYRLEEAQKWEFLERLWQRQREVFSPLQNLELLPDWQGDDLARLEFLRRGMILQDLLTPKILLAQGQSFGVAKVLRWCELRPWVVEGRPSLSLSIRSYLVHKLDLWEFSQTSADLQGLVGLGVLAKDTFLEGRVGKVIGRLSDHRRRLISLSQEPWMQRFLERAGGEQWVVQIQTERYTYDYASGALYIHLRPRDFERFGLKSSLAWKALSMPVRLRIQLIGKVAALLKARGYLSDAYRSDTHPSCFPSLEELGLGRKVRLATGEEVEWGGTEMYSCIQRAGICGRSPFLSEEIRLGIVHFTRLSVKNFLYHLRQELKSFGIQSVLAFQTKLYTADFSKLEAFLERREDSHIFLYFLPRSSPLSQRNALLRLRYLTLQKSGGVPCVWVYPSGLRRRERLQDVVVAILVRTGHSLFRIQSEVGEVVVGLQRVFSPEWEGRRGYFLRAYSHEGVFLGYRLGVLEEGESWPALLGNWVERRIFVQVWGRLSQKERQEWEEFARPRGGDLLELMTKGAPRIYALRRGWVESPPLGAVFRISDTEAFWVSKTPPYGGTLAQPLWLRSEGGIERALRGMVPFCFLSGIRRFSSLPAPLLRGEEIGRLVEQGWKGGLGCQFPFWL